MAALPGLMTVEQFRRLPDDGHAYELHHGEVVPVTRPKAKHYKLQHRLVRLLEPLLASFGQVGTEFSYRPVAEFDLRVADVAVVSHARWDSIDPEDNLHGAPELVIEIMSPSNTARQMRDLASLCLANGCEEFWILDPDQRSVTIIRQDGSSAAFGPGDSVSLASFEAEALTVDSVFA